MKITVRIKRTVTKLPNGKTIYGPEPSKEEQEKRQAWLENHQVSEAIKHFHRNRDLSPLLELFKEANPGILRSEEALDLISRSAAGEKLIGRGRIRTKQNIECDLQIAKAVFWLKKTGLPEMNDRELNKTNPSACFLVGERICLSDTAVNSIVKKVNYSPTIFDLEPREPLSTQSILKFFFPTEEEEQEAIRELLYSDSSRYE